MTTLKPSWYSVDGTSFISDILNLLHPPYTLWHLSYVLIGVALAPQIFLSRSIAVLVAFFLGLGVGAHALDETMGNPLQTRLSRLQLYAIGSLSLGAAMIIGVYYALTVSYLLFAFVAVESFFALAYNLESFQKRFHNTVVFALSWGTIPFLAGYFVNALSFSPAILLMGVAVGLLTVVQKTLSTQARKIRRKMKPVEGLQLRDGEILKTSSEEIVKPSEVSLKILSLTIFLIAIALLLQKLY
ncbi:MAG: UbiA prenyltransferase family protein [Nitrososphaerales archaeon]